MAGEAAALKEVKQPIPEGPPRLPKELTITLSEPVMAHGERIDKLIFRAPTGGDLMASGAGWPIAFNEMGQAFPNPKVMGEMMSTLASVPPSTIKALTARDYATCSFALSRFFSPDDQWLQLF